MYDGRCPACGRPILHRSTRRGWAWRRHIPWRRVAVGLLVAVGAAAGWKFAARSTRDDGVAWRVRDRALGAFRAGDYGPAAEGFREITSNDSGDAPAWFMLASSDRAAGLALDVWMPSVRRAVEADPSSGPANRLLATALVEAGEADRAVPHARTAVQARPDDAAAWRVLGTALLLRATPSLPEAEQTFTRARELGDAALTSVVSLAEVRLRRTGWLHPGSQPPDLAEALRAASAALEPGAGTGPGGQAAVGLARAQIAAAQGDARAAHEFASTALGRIEASEQSAALRAEVLLVRARAGVLMGDMAGAGSDVAAALQVRPEYDVADQAIVLHSGAPRDDVLAILARAAERRDPAKRLRTVLAELHVQRGDPASAARALGAVPANPPADLRTRLVQGDIEAAFGRPGAAESIYRACAVADPLRPEPVVRLAALALRGDDDSAARARRISESVEQLETARARIGDAPSIGVALGRLHAATGAPTKSREEFRRVTVAAPAASWAWRLFGAACLRDGGDASAASQAFRRARLLDAGNPGLARFEAEALLLAGDAGGAAAVCTSDLRLRPSDPVLLGLRARANRRMGLWSAAAADLRVLYEAGARDEPTVVGLVEAEVAAKRPAVARAIVAEASARASPRLAAMLEAAMSPADADAAGAADVAASRTDESSVSGTPADEVAALAGDDGLDVGRFDRVTFYVEFARAGGPSATDVIANPEPGTLAFVALGALGLGVVVFRRRAAAARPPAA